MTAERAPDQSPSSPEASNEYERQLQDIARKLRTALLRKDVAGKRLQELKDTILQYFTVAKDEDKTIDPGVIARWADAAEKQGYKALLEASDREAQELSVRYGKLTCRPVCEEMQRRLPRELRDTVYALLLPEMDYVWEPYADQECVGCKIWEPPGCEIWEPPGMRCRRHMMPHLHSADHLGDNMLLELAEMWYSTSNFEFGYDYTFQDLLREHVWKTPVQPNTYINRVLVNFMDFEFMGSVDTSKWKEPTEASANLRDHLSQFSTLRQGAKIEVNFRLYSKYWKSPKEHLEQLADILDPGFLMLKTLHEQGYKVSVSSGRQHRPRDFAVETILTAREWVESLTWAF